MLGKRMHHNSKGRLASKSHDNGKPSSPGVTPHSKPAKIPGTSGGKTKVEMCPIPYMKTQDNAANLPRFTAITARSADEPIAMDELDSLQLELESLLSTTALRIRFFQSEIESIDTNESKREKKGKAAGKQLQYPVKRKFQDDKLVKTRDYTKLSNQPKVPKFKNFSNASGTSHNYQSDLVNSDNSVKLELSQLTLPKNNIPYKFWNSVEPYCAPVTLDDIKFLESLLAQSSNTTLPPIPPLGKHYSEVWADEHLAEDQNASNPNKMKSSGMSPEASTLRKKLDKSNENIITGPLTQRLVSALMEENVMPYDVPDVKVKATTNTKSSYKNSLTLEKCLRKELVEQGILDPEDLPPLTNPADDEILTEIKKCQTELTAVRKDNCRNLKHLIGLCKQEMIRLNLKKQLDQVDMECIEIYKKMVAAKQKKRPITKKEKDDAWRAINEQIRLNKEINALPLTGPNTS